jgi:hypothetical protein
MVALVVGVTVVVLFVVLFVGVAVCANVIVAAAIAETANTPVAITAFLIMKSPPSVRINFTR